MSKSKRASEIPEDSKTRDERDRLQRQLDEFGRLLGGKAESSTGELKKLLEAVDGVLKAQGVQPDNRVEQLHRIANPPAFSGTRQERDLQRIWQSTYTRVEAFWLDYYEQMSSSPGTGFVVPSVPVCRNVPDLKTQRAEAARHARECADALIADLQKRIPRVVGPAELIDPGLTRTP